MTMMPKQVSVPAPWELWGGPYCGKLVMLQPGTNAVRLPSLPVPSWAHILTGSVKPTSTLTVERYVEHPTKPRTLRWTGTSAS
jgi:hypothetical protein